MCAQTSSFDKNERRRALKKMRSDMGPQKRQVADADIAQRVIATDEYAHAHYVFCYVSFGDEIDTRALIECAWSDGKTVVAPRCVGKRVMEWHRIHSFEELERSAFGVDEPRSDPSTRIHPQEAENAIALVPGLEFDERGYRLGYGGGFYDTFLATFPGTSIGLCRDEFFNDDGITREEHDLPTHMVITQSCTRYCRN